MADSAWPAPAKLNLFLRVVGRRADGYHRLQTLFQLLDWGDEVRIRVADDPEITREVDIAGVSERDDLSLVAARRLRKLAGVSRGARIGVVKRIPQGAGLGGGSSDAATVLVALNELWSCGLSRGELAELGAGIGADVPVFVRGHTAWGEGIGEELTPVTLGPRHYVLLMPGESVRTELLFRNLGPLSFTPPLDREAVLAEGNLAGLGNALEDRALELVPALAELRGELARFGPWRMTGSGSAFFIEMEDKNAAARLTSELKSRYNVRAVGGVDRSPLLDRLASG